MNNFSRPLLSTPPWLTGERHHVFGKSCTNSTGQMELHRVDHAATGARYCGKAVTGIQDGKLTTAKKIQFLQAPVASFACELQFFDRSKFWLHWIELRVFFCIILLPGGFTYCTYPHAQEQSYCIYYQVTISWKENSSFQFWYGRMLETDKAFTSNIIRNCKLQLRDHTDTMIHSQNQFSSHLQISKGAPVFDWFGMASLIRKSSCNPHLFHI